MGHFCVPVVSHLPRLTKQSHQSLATDFTLPRRKHPLTPSRLRATKPCCWKGPSGHRVPPFDKLVHLEYTIYARGYCQAAANTTTQKPSNFHAACEYLRNASYVVNGGDTANSERSSTIFRPARPPHAPSDVFSIRQFFTPSHSRL